jgi:arylsulfatase A-like enzyme
MLRWMLSLAVVMAWAANANAAEGGKPNIIVIVADDLGYGDLGLNGGKQIPTPHIDSLATNGVRCANGYVSGPYCSPTRAGLMTGRYQQRFGHEFNPGPPTDASKGFGLPLRENPLPARMQAAGYVTGMVGKWHLGHAESMRPPSRGFDEFFGFWGGAHSYVNARAEPNNPIVRGEDVIDEPAYLTEAFAREAASFIDRHKREPFFLYYSFNAVHTPMEATDKYTERFASITDPKRRTYAGMLSAMDDAIGVVLAKLDQEQLTENTLIFFISDNGGPETANSSDNGPFRGQKAQTWEGGIHVPFIVQWKAQLPAGKVYEEPVIQLDILPTILAATKTEVSAGDKFDGVNLLPYLKGDNTGAPHEALYWRFGAQIAIRMGPWKLVKGPGTAGLEQRTKATTEGAELYNLQTDIGEQTNLAATETAQFNKLEAAWNAWNAELVEPAWTPIRNTNNRARRRATQQQ